MASIATAWLMTSLDPSPLMVSLVSAATNLPLFLFALPAGALADIVDRRKLLISPRYSCWRCPCSARVGVSG
jgi:MFS family permease